MSKPTPKIVTMDEVEEDRIYWSPRHVPERVKEQLFASQRFLRGIPTVKSTGVSGSAIRAWVGSDAQYVVAWMLDPVVRPAVLPTEVPLAQEQVERPLTEDDLEMAELDLILGETKGELVERFGQVEFDRVVKAGRASVDKAIREAKRRRGRSPMNVPGITMMEIISVARDLSVGRVIEMDFSAPPGERRTADSPSDYRMILSMSGERFRADLDSDDHAGRYYHREAATLGGLLDEECGQRGSVVAGWDIRIDPAAMKPTLIDSALEDIKGKRALLDVIEQALLADS